MARKRNYALDILQLHQEFAKRNDVESRHPFEIGEIVAVTTHGDFSVRLEYSDYSLADDEITWMFDDSDLQEGDMVAIAFDAAGDPIGLSSLSATAGTIPVTSAIELGTTEGVDLISPGGIGGPYTSNHTINSTVEPTVFADTNGGSINLTLPDTPADGTIVVIKDVGGDADDNPIFILPGGSATIEGFGSTFIDVAGMSLSLIYQASTDTWFII